MSPSSMSLRTRRLLAAILLLALLARVGAACGMQWLLDNKLHRQFLISGDAEGYWELGKKLARGEAYAVHEPPRRVHRMPGFPAILAVSIRLFGEHLFPARLTLAVAGAFAVWLVFLVGRKLSGDAAGLIAAALAAVSPTFVAFSVIELSETAFAAALLVNILAADRLYRLLRSNGGWSLIAGWGLLTGASVALGTLMRPSWILAAPVQGLLLIWLAPLGAADQKRITRLKSFAAAALLGGGLVLVLLPWGMRNARVSGHFTLTTFWAGPSLYDGLNPRATGDSDMRFYDEDRLSEKLSEYEIDREYSRRAWEFVRQNPGRAAELAAIKAARYWSIWPNAEQFQNRWLGSVIGAFVLPAFLLAAIGLFRLAQGGCLDSSALAAGGLGSSPRLTASDSQQPPHCQQVPACALATWPDRVWSIAVLAGPVLYFALLHMLFVSSLRYRLPAEYPLLVLSAVGLVSLWRRRTTVDG